MGFYDVVLGFTVAAGDLMADLVNQKGDGLAGGDPEQYVGDSSDEGEDHHQEGS